MVVVSALGAPQLAFSLWTQAWLECPVLLALATQEEEEERHQEMLHWKKEEEQERHKAAEAKHIVLLHGPAPGILGMRDICIAV